MIDINKHKFFLVQILKDIYSDIELANCLGFKGGSALMFFYELPRFSIDLDFNLISEGKEKIVYEKVRKILLKYGTIYDEAQKFYGLSEDPGSWKNILSLVWLIESQNGGCKGL